MGYVKRYGMNDKLVSETKLPCGYGNENQNKFANSRPVLDSNQNMNIPNIIINVQSQNSKDSNTERPVITNPVVARPVINNVPVLVGNESYSRETNLMNDREREERLKRIVSFEENRNSDNTIREKRIIAEDLPRKNAKITCAETFYQEFP